MQEPESMNTNNGWKLVPVESTEEQVKAWSHDDHGGLVTAWYRRAIYAAMLAAAHEAPPPTVTIDPDPRGVSVGVYQGSSCVYHGAHPIPAGAVADEGAKDERRKFEAWAKERGYQSDELARCELGIVSPEYFNLNTENAWKAWQGGRASVAAPAAGDALEIDLDRVLSIADEHAEESREDGRRVLDRGGLLALARDVLRAASQQGGE